MKNNSAFIEPEVTIDLAIELGLTEDEYRRVNSILGRTPSYTELSIYSVMWSEHCSYKNSIAILKTLPRSGGRLLVGAGEENAGLVDIGDGLAVAFKIESHNHPSAVEPYQGAATGVGGILRDIFTMGARPIAALNSLRFGNLTNERTRYLFKNVVKGIGDYGNSFGVPTIGGEIYFDDCYQNNPLVNAMAVGIVEHGKIAKSVAQGVGNLVMIVGSSTGRDGIHGATFASEELSEKSEEKRPSVQVGDPFTEKLLVEATLEAIATGFVVGIQDMGAAGITCSTTEMSAKGRCGMIIDLDRVPLREKDMSSHEIMLSESQERMLLIVEKGHEAEVQKIFEKWDLDGIIIGEVSMDPYVMVYHGSELKASVLASSLVLGEGAPVYHRDARAPEYIKKARSFDPTSLPAPSVVEDVFYDLMARPTLASKSWAYSQYDSMVRTNSLDGDISDAAVIRLKGSRKALALKTDCNSRYVYLNPRRGGEIAVAEAARNVVCTGAKPLAITNCLNFGNPYDPEVYWQFKEAVAGIGDACRILETPVTGGNVSFYNENPQGAIHPTPVIGMLGLIEDVDYLVPSSFQREGDHVILLGKNRSEIGGSEYLLMCTGEVLGDAPALDLEYERQLQYLLLTLVNSRKINSAHDTAEGGLAVALAECCFGASKTLGANIRVDELKNVREDFLLFGESQSRIIVSCDPEHSMHIVREAKRFKIDAAVIGTVLFEPRLRVNTFFNGDLQVARDRYNRGLERILGEG